MWKSMVLQSSIILTRKMSLPTHSHVFHVVMFNSSGGECSCCSSQLHFQGLNISNDPDLLECFLNLPLTKVAETNPVNFAWIYAQQNTGTELATKAAKYPEQYFNKLIDGHVIVCHALPNENCLTWWKIALTKEMVIPLIKWYHCILAHPGWKRSRMTIQARYYHQTFKNMSTTFTVTTANVLNFPAKEWDYYQNATSPIHHGMSLPSILLDSGLQRQTTSMVNSIHWHALTPPLISLNSLALTPIEVMPLQENLKILGWLDTQDWYKFSVIMAANSLDMPLLASLSCSGNQGRSHNK